MCNSAKFCKSFVFVECERGKCDSIARGKGDNFRNGKYELLALNETKMKGNGKVS